MPRDVAITDIHGESAIQTASPQRAAVLEAAGPVTRDQHGFKLAGLAGRLGDPGGQIPSRA